MELQHIKVNLALDIGGTLTKVGISSNRNIAPLIFDQNQRIDSMQIISQSQQVPRQVFYFRTYSKFDDFFVFLKQRILKFCQILNIVATGGGALKYKSQFNELNDTIQNPKITYEITLNEFEAILPSVKLLLQDKHNIQFTKGTVAKPSILIQNNEDNQKDKKCLKTPLLLVNIGSGMSVLKLEEKQGKLQFQRIGGSALAGGFFVGVEKIMNQQFSFEQFQKYNKIEESCAEELKLMRFCVENLSQIISLYSDIFKIDTILITGGITSAQLIRSEMLKNLKDKKIWFTQINSYLGVVGLLINCINRG